jgi:hypothetical protein
MADADTSLAAVVAIAVAPDEPAHPWADLDPERIELLRLAPLETDRSTGARPLCFAQLGHLERHSREYSLLRLSLQLPAQRLRAQQNVLEVWADHRRQELRFGPDSGLAIEPQNRGLGRFLLAQGVRWAQQKYAHYDVEGGALGNKDTLADDTRLRRDHALGAQGFSIDYPDPKQLKAHYAAAQVSVLSGDWNTEKVQVLPLLEAAALLQQADQSLRELDVKRRQQDLRIQRFQREDGGLRFTIACLVAFCLFQAGLLIWIATR